MITAHDALIYTMVMVSAADRDMTDIELKQIGRLVKELPAFKGYPVDRLTDTARECAVILNAKDGLDRSLALIGRALPGPLRETAYLLACELAAIDRRVPLEELRLLRLLRQSLQVDKLAAAALERATLARLATAHAEVEA